MSGGRLVDAFCTTPALAELFSDASLVSAMLEFEAALAVAEAGAGVIPAEAAASIASVARDIDLSRVDMASFIAQTRRSATAGVPLVALLVDRVRQSDQAAAAYVHFGATSQDVVDTALVLLLQRARPLLQPEYERLARALTSLSNAHATTVMLGRTLLQPATPITFGLTAAVWVAGVHEGWWRLHSALSSADTVQFGGAAGTRAALGEHAPQVAALLASGLGLQSSPPWHTRRGRIAAIANECAILAGALGKIARDVALLMQGEISEVSAAGGGSTAMPHKRNPSGAAVALAATQRVPGLVSGLSSGLVQEHERALGGWQLEWSALSATIQATGAALVAVADIVETLEVFPDRMRANLDATKGAVFAERATLMLRAAVGREAAETLVSRALARSASEDNTFPDALRADADAVRALGARLDTLDRLDDDVAAAERVRRELIQG